MKDTRKEGEHEQRDSEERQENGRESENERDRREELL
jgi:hypothetical protein